MLNTHGDIMKLKLTFKQFNQYLEPIMDDVADIHEFDVKNHLVSVLLTFKSNREPLHVQLLDPVPLDLLYE
jgi:hypothetical protein